MTAAKKNQKFATKRIVTKHACESVKRFKSNSPRRNVVWIRHSAQAAAQIEGVNMHNIRIRMNNLLLVDESEAQEMDVVMDDCDIPTDTFQFYFLVRISNLGS